MLYALTDPSGEQRVYSHELIIILEQTLYKYRFSKRLCQNACNIGVNSWSQENGLNNISRTYSTPHTNLNVI